MNKMSLDNFEWSQHLGCPLIESFQEHEKSLLNCGVVSFAWDEISSRSLPINDVLETRKNILLYYLKNKIKVASIEHINNINKLRFERSKINERLATIESEYDQINKSDQSKSCKISQLKSLKKSIKVKKMIIHFKHNEIKKDINTCNELLSECQNLQPPESNIIDEAIMDQIIASVSTISCREDKREAWQQISKDLGSISILELWKWLLNKRIQDTNKVTHLELSSTERNEGAEHVNSMNDDKKIQEENDTVNSHHNTELAKVYSKHILNAVKIVKYTNETEKYENSGVDYIEKILLCDENKVFNDWLEITIQISSLERERAIFKHYINYFDSIYNEKENLRIRYSQLSCNLQEITVNMIDCLRKFQNSLIRLKPSAQFIFHIKNLLMTSLNNIMTISNSNHSEEWLHLNISTEIDEFYKNFNINALNKIMLINTKNPYRHTLSCMSNALLATPSLSVFVPVYQTPIYNIINCLKSISMNKLFKQQKPKLNFIEELTTALKVSDLIIAKKDIDVMELLDNATFLSDKCHKELEQLDTLYDIWVHQSMQSVMTIMDNVVHKTTFSEWIKRYTTVIYMIQKNKQITTLL